MFLWLQLYLGRKNKEYSFLFGIFWLQIIGFSYPLCLLVLLANPDCTTTGLSIESQYGYYKGFFHFIPC